MRTRRRHDGRKHAQVRSYCGSASVSLEMGRACLGLVFVSRWAVLQASVAHAGAHAQQQLLR